MNFSNAILHKPQDASDNQRLAADPNASVWVSASAGSGKTKVLIDRLLRLLLPNTQGEKGSPVNKILCLTFTKAGAGEMSIRLRDTLADWASCDNLEEKLQDLLGSPPTKPQLTCARLLLGDVLDSPFGLQIMTIHAFCQSVLGRFTLEAGLSAGFKAIEEVESKRILTKSIDDVLKKVTREQGSINHDAFVNITNSVGQAGFSELFASLASQRSRIQKIANKNWGAHGLKSEIRQYLNAPLDKTHDDVLNSACDDEAFDVENMRIASGILLDNGKKVAKSSGAKISKWLSEDRTQRMNSFWEYYYSIASKTSAIKHNLITKKIEEDYPECHQTIMQEVERLSKVVQTLQAIKCADLSFSLLLLSEEILTQYSKTKNELCVLDYDDMILKTLALLDGSSMGVDASAGASWVHYKLDNGIDHILLDEAQDTNPDQWEVIAALANEFFVGLSASQKKRTVFAVGDTKQSIYGFQRAAPEEFDKKRQYFKDKSLNCGNIWRDVGLHVSFRTTPAVLRVVDKVFENPDLLGEVPTAHYAYRDKDKGVVEAWPLIEGDKNNDDEEGENSIWSPPTKIIHHKSAVQKMADYIADNIERWIKKGEILPSTGMPVSAGDIMILVRKRAKIADILVRTLKRKGIAVSGRDTLYLYSHLAAQDLISLAKFSLLQDDDLSLACVLKSPLIGWDDDDLFNIAHNRDASLWLSLQSNEEHRNIAKYLKSAIDMASKLSAFEFFSKILESPCPCDEVSGRRAIWARLGVDAIEPMDELLSIALDFDSGDDVPTLQNFIAVVEANPDAKIKRDMTEASDEVRIMTVHGSKGLQSPIVIIPEDVSSSGGGKSDEGDKLLWSQNGIPIWSPDIKSECEKYTALMEAKKQKDAHEEWRGCYVAMTRAKDKLYVGGYNNSNKSSKKDSWHSTIRCALEDIEGSTANKDGVITFCDNLDLPSYERHEESEAVENKLPCWIYKNAPKDPNVTEEILSPSRMHEEDDDKLAPLMLAAGRSQKKAMQYGDLMHGLLQLLPSLARDERKNSGLLFAMSRTSREEAQSALENAIDIIEDEKFAHIFGENSMAEVAISGRLKNGNLVSGRIDRIVISDDEIMIVDFKTGSIPRDVNNIPPLYKSQMAAYRDLVSQMYEKHNIRCAFLFTNGGILIEI